MREKSAVSSVTSLARTERACGCLQPIQLWSPLGIIEFSEQT